MPRKPPPENPISSGGLSALEVAKYLSSLGFENITIDEYPLIRTTIEADLADKHYIASSGESNSLNAAEAIMVGYWKQLAEGAPFDLPADRAAQIYKKVYREDHTPNEL